MHGRASGCSQMDVLIHIDKCFHADNLERLLEKIALFAYFDSFPRSAGKRRSRCAAWHQERELGDVRRR